ncbi:unnamed protein product [Clonostachys rosea f. rosea IK726]|uniref:Transaldolase n=2 Tax=Bionectria ochroleuca TaxID=29856 RepID=A0A0B7KCE0_BIOOC|nr:unnamed protein product [Clonostachys rosea f. rosea IK726]
MAGRTLLTRLDELCNVDVDDADIEFIKSLPFKPYNQTSNQAIITQAITSATNRPILSDCIKKYGSQGWETVFERVSVRICANNVPLIKGRVLIQTSPRHIHDDVAIIDQCRRFAAAFEEADVPRDRFAIKVPFTGSGAVASRTLNAEGIRTLATAVFCLEQAIAASQSGCLLISPYFNEIAAHFDPALRPNVADTALQHPMSPRIIQMLEAFKTFYTETGEEQPIMVIASHLSPEEVLAMAELGCQHVTVSQDNYRQLIASPDESPATTHSKPTHPYAGLSTPERLQSLAQKDPLSAAEKNGLVASLDTDYVAQNGKILDAAIERDSVAGKRMNDAMKFFTEWEEKAKQIIEDEISKLRLT